jgi:hypothetical protein
MPGLRLRISLEGGRLPFDLRDLLATIGEPALRSSWVLEDVWATVDGPPEQNPLEDLAQAGRRVGGEELMGAADRTAQVVDGWFGGFAAEARDPWIVLFADDSTYWFVFSRDTGLLERIGSQFNPGNPISADELEDWRQYPLVHRCLSEQ